MKNYAGIEVELFERLISQTGNILVSSNSVFYVDLRQVLSYFQISAYGTFYLYENYSSMCKGLSDFIMCNRP